MMEEARGFRAPRLWHRDRPQRPKAWARLPP